MDEAQIATTLKAAALDWSSTDPSILGTLSERGLDPGKRSQLGAHYTDRDKIMRIADPLVVDPWLAEWETTKAHVSTSLERASKAMSQGAATRHRKQAERTLSAFLERLRELHDARSRLRLGELPVSCTPRTPRRGAPGAA